MFRHFIFILFESSNPIACTKGGTANSKMWSNPLSRCRREKKKTSTDKRDKWDENWRFFLTLKPISGVLIRKSISTEMIRKEKKNKTCLRHRLLDVGTKHRESKRSKGPFVLSTFCLSIFCPGLHLFWCISIRSPDKAGDPLSLERMVHGTFFFLGKVAKIMWKQKILYFLHLV